MAEIEDIDMLNHIIVEALTHEGHPPELAQQAASMVIARLQNQRGGTRLYITSVRQQREKQILREWQQSDGNPDDMKKIATRHSVDVSTVYRVINRSRKKRGTKQATGFGSDEWSL